MSKHLIICLDGTWCDGDSADPQTNIRLLSDILDPKPEGGSEQRIYYNAGVGTGGFLDRIAGGVFGKGLSANVLAAYRFLSQFYEPGDKIYVFGFSRGAFTARSLCGFLSASGLLTQDMCNAANQEFAWNYYRTPPKKRYPADRARLRRITHNNPEARIRFLGVFDTVGALGIPQSFMSWIGRRAIHFHDTEVSSVVDHSCQALAIDEYRLEFEPAVWTEPRHRKYQTVEQVWFPGSHANIGGGCADTDLSDLALIWMLQRLRRHCPEVGFTWKEPLLERFGRYPSCTGKIFDPRSWIFWRSRWRPTIRSINRCEPGRRWLSRLFKPRPHSWPIGEMVHQSAVQRWEQTKDERRRHRYQPPNLLAAIESRKTVVVGFDGEPISAVGRSVGNGAQTARAEESPPPRAVNGDGHAVMLPTEQGAEQPQPQLH